MVTLFHSLGSAGTLFRLIAAIALAVSFSFDLLAQNKVFTTSTTYPATLGGVAAYDQQCNLRATAAGLNGPTNNDFIAWMSDATSNAVTRLGPTPQGFVRTDGAPFTQTVSSLVTNNAILNPIDRDEFGNAVSANTVVWASTDFGGTSTGMHCTNWTSTSGFATLGSSSGGPRSWTNYTNGSCNSNRPIYCVQKTKTQPLTISPAPGRLAFLSSGNFTPSSGMAAADNICSTEAAGAGLTGNFKAFLATTSNSAASLLQPATIDYTRVDGIRIGSYSDISAGANLSSGIWQTAAGTYAPPSLSVWTGATLPNALGTAASTCSNWSSSAPTGISGFAQKSDPTWWLFSGATQCNQSTPVYCLQSSGGTPPSPTRITVSNITATGMTVSWTGTAPQFRVIYKSGAAPSGPLDGTVIFEGAGSSTPVTGLAEDTRYFIAVYGKIGAVYSANAVTTSVTTTPTARISSLGSSNDPWDRRSSPTRNGQFIFGDNNGDLKLFNGTSVITVQAKGSFATNPNTVFTLGTASDPAHLIAAWRRDDAYVSTDGGTPLTINAANPVSPGTPMNAEFITVDGGCVFVVFRAVSGGNDRRNAFRVDPATGNATPLTNNTSVFGVVHMSSSGCKAAWAFDDGTGSNKLHYYNGSSVTTIDQNIIGDPSIAQGRIVYTKHVAAGNDEVFGYDTNLPSPSPVQLTNDPAKTNDSPFTDGRHAAWVRRNLNLSGPEIVFNGGYQLTSGNFALKENAAAPSFDLNRGQILWRDTGGVLHHDTSTSSALVDTGGSATTSIPWLSDGRIVFIESTASPKNLYRFVGKSPDDSAQPSAPMFLRATPGSSSVTLNWDAILGATSYNVYYSTQPGLTKANYVALGAGKVTGILSPSYTVTGLDSNSAYYFIVTAVDGGGEGPESRQASTVLFGAPSWTSVGGLTGVDMPSVASDRVNGNEAYASGGNNTYATTNGGLNWTALTGLIAGADVRGLAAHGGTVFATSRPGAVFRSTNSGAAWTSVVSGTSGQFQQAIAIDPAIPATIVAGDIQLPSYAGTGTDASLIRSDDNGATWFHTPEYTPGGTLVTYGLAFDPTKTSTLYLGGNGTPNVAMSLAGGAGWIDRGLPTNGASSGYVYTLAVDPQNSRTLYAGTTQAFAGQTPGVWKSINGGSTWTKLSGGLPATTRVHSIIVDPAASNMLHLGTEDGYYYSTNSGTNWTLLNTGLPNLGAKYINQLALTGSHRLIAGTSDGLYLLNLNSAVPPAVSLVSPASGNIGGGTAVTITGTNFKSGATVKIGGIAASNVVFQNSTTLTATTPAHAAGAVDVVVTNPDGQTGTRSSGFSYTAIAPMITTQPTSHTIASGQTTQLSAAASGDNPLSYQWYIGTSGDTSTPIQGATSNTYTTPTLTMTTNYWVRVSNAGGTANSATATITVSGTTLKRRGQVTSF